MLVLILQVLKKLLSNRTTQDEVASIDKNTEATSKERKDNCRKKEEDRITVMKVVQNKTYRNSTRRKRTFTYVHKKGICMHTSQLDRNESNDLSTSTSTSTTV